MNKNILLVDDEDHFRERLGRALVKRGYQVTAAADYGEAMTVLADTCPDMAIIDLRMPGRSGLELVKSALEKYPDLKIVVLTGYGSIATATDAIRLGAMNYISKPADTDEILAAFSETSAPEKMPNPEEISTPSLARVEWEHISRVLADCGGNISAAAKRLNIHRRTLQRKLEKFPPFI
ncbi:MAG: response regulator [Proteobacteria bacterium]|nr:response regulator [Pseudomonadota bacterium]MBU1739545.1 response regulator [Pseudomonadota bacterium]